MNALKRHYHWVIALIIFVEMVLYGGFLNAASVFTVPITEDLLLTRGGYALAQIPKGIVGFFSTLATGFLLHRFGYRKSAIVSLISFVGGLVVLAFAQTLTMIGIAYGIMGLSHGICTTAGAVWMVKSWFRKHQGLLLGIVTMATGVGGSIMSMLLTKLTIATNWRQTHIISACLISMLAVLYLLLRDRPEQMGLRPYGDGVIPGKKRTVDAAHTEWEGYTLRENLRNPQFYLMALCTLLSSTTVYLTLTVIVPHFQDGGFSASEAAGFQSVLMLCLSVAKLVGGWLSDRIGAKPMTLLCAVCAAAGQYLLADVSNAFLCYVGIVLFCVGLLSVSITVPLLIMPLFGYRAFGNLTGIFLAMISLGNMVAGPIVNLLYDRLGSYAPVFRVAALIDIALIGLYLLCWRLGRLPTHPEG